MRTLDNSYELSSLKKCNKSSNQSSQRHRNSIKRRVEDIRRQYDDALKKETAKFEEMLRSPKSSNLPKQVEEVEVQVSGVNLSQTSNLL